MRPHLNHFSRPPRPPAVGDIGQQLRELPAEIAPPCDFAEFQRRSHERSAPKRQVVTWPYAAAAAGLTAVVAAMAMLGTSDGTRPGGEASAAAPVTGSAAASVTPGGGAPTSGHSSAADSKEDPAEQARVAREWLAHQPAEPAVVRPGPRLAVASLEDRIAWFDDTLTEGRLHGASPAQLKLLQQERARLVSSLAQVRYAEALVADGS